MKVLFLNPAAQLGGAERVLLDMVACLREQNDVTVTVVLAEDGPLISELRRAGAAHVHVLPLPDSLARFGEASSRLRMLAAVPGAIGYRRSLRKLIVQIEPDVIHSNGLKMHALSAMALAQETNPPVVWHIHDFLGQRRMMGWVLRRFAWRAKLALAVSNAVARDLRKVLPDTRVETVLNAIDVEHFAPAPTRQASDVVRVGLIATYARWKGHDVVIDAVARVKASNVRFSIIGGPIYATAGSQFSRVELEAMAARAGIGGRIEFIDFQADPRDVYRSLDIVVHASTKPEPFGRTIVEAMACGCATIVSAAGGAVELFEDGVDAIGVSPGDSGALAGAIDRLAADRSLRDSLGSTAVETARRRFDRQRIGPALADIYRKLIAER